MLKLVDLARLGRPVRQEDVDDLGVPTQTMLRHAIDQGRLEEAKLLADYTIAESKGLHDLFCDWLWELLTQIADRFGEDALGEILRASQGSWMLRRSWKGFLGLSVHERLSVTAEIMRSHHGGPEQDGRLTIVEDEHRYSLIMDPCTH